MERRATQAALAAGAVELALAFPLHLPVSGFILAVLAGDLMRLPELGQIIHNNPVNHRMPDFAEALMFRLRTEIARVYWNTHQKSWAGAGLGDIGGGIDPWDEDFAQLSFDPDIPGIEWRPYYNWSGMPEDEDWDQAEADKPNFKFGEVEVRWYKHFGRSMNANIDWAPVEWVEWFDRAMATIRAADRKLF